MDVERLKLALVAGGMSVRSIEPCDHAGRKAFTVTGSKWGTFSLGGDWSVVHEGQGFATREATPANVGDLSLEDADNTSGKARIQGVASSTSIDSHGTEMSTNFLSRMAEQFTAGVAYVPAHHEREWYDTIGKTSGAQLLRTAVMSAADGAEDQMTLKVDIDLDDCEKSSLLMRKLKNGEKIGQSIGAWFTRVIFVEGDDGSIERVIIDDGKLDHLAVTRSPSNPDSNSLTVIREAAMNLRADHEGNGTMDGEDDPGDAEAGAEEEEPESDPETEDEEVEPEPEEERSAPPLETRGEALGALLRQLIEKKMKADDISREDIIEGMAKAADIEPTTVRDIVRGHIKCPPLKRLSAFSEYFDVTTDSMLGAAESDECSYTRDCGDCAELETRSIHPEGDAMSTTELSEIKDLLGKLIEAQTRSVQAQTPVVPAALTAEQIEAKIAEAVAARSAALEAERDELLAKVLSGRAHTQPSGLARLEETFESADRLTRAATNLTAQGKHGLAKVLKLSATRKLVEDPASLSLAELDTLLVQACRAGELDAEVGPGARG